jgi:hypothetical protein
MLETSFCCQLGAILQKDFSKMTTTPPMTERLPHVGYFACIRNKKEINSAMKIHLETIKEFGNVLIRFGEAAVIGGAAALVVQSFSFWLAFSAIAGGVILVFTGLYFVNKSHL